MNQYKLFRLYSFYKESALWNAVHRSVWGLVISWVIFACASGHGGPINTFLSWPFLLPFSRLSYCTYLVHLCVVYYHGLVQRTPFYAHLPNLIFAFLGILVVSFLLGFAVSMAFELPFMNLEKIVRAGLSWVTTLPGKISKKVVGG